MKTFGISMMFLICFVSCLFGQETAPQVFPIGSSDHRLEGLKVSLRIPDGLTKEKPGSLVILLHGAGGVGKTLMTLLHDWEKEGYVVCAPQASAQTWSRSDLLAVEKIGVSLLKKIPLNPKHLHVMGFSNGGWNLPSLAFSEQLKPLTATYVGAGFTGKKPPTWAKKQHNVLAVAGKEDPNAPSALATPGLLAKKVRSVEARLQENLGHRWPRELNPYMLWWMGVQEGRFRYGESLAFNWCPNLDTAKERMATKKKGKIVVYVYDSEKKSQMSLAQHWEQDLFLDPAIRFYGNQLCIVEIDLHLKKWPFGTLPQTPFVAILSHKGELRSVLKTKSKKKSVRRALKKLAPQKKVALAGK